LPISSDGKKLDKFLIQYDWRIAKIQVFTHHPVLNHQHEDLNGSPSTKFRGSTSIQNYKYYAIRSVSKKFNGIVLSAATTIVS
jgi:hypothetical protein